MPGARVSTLPSKPRAKIFPRCSTLLVEVLREPAFDPKELEQLRTEWLASMEQRRSEPSSLAFTAFQKHLKPYPANDIRYVESIDESIAGIKAVTREQLVKFHQTFFGAQPAQVAVVGDFDAAEIEKQFSTLLGDWKNPRPFTRVANKYFDVPASEMVIETPDKAQAFFVAGHNLALRDDDPDYPALVLGNYMLGGGFLNSRLMTRIRGKDGLSYGTGSQLQGDNFDKAGGFLAYAIYAPENLAKLQKAFDEEIARVLAEDFTKDEVEQAKSGWLQGRGVSRAQDNELVGALAHYAVRRPHAGLGCGAREESDGARCRADSRGASAPPGAGEIHRGEGRRFRGRREEGGGEVGGGAVGGGAGHQKS